MDLVVVLGSHLNHYALEVVLLKVIRMVAHIARNVIRHIPSVRETTISGRHESITLIESIVDLVDVWFTRVRWTATGPKL
jgi:hypothetical protein